MNNKKLTLLCCVLLSVVSQAASADKEEDKSVEFEEELKHENNSSMDVGPPDSHEAMNNREINPGMNDGGKVREKRSYEFLMGLVNNNSRYEVTNVDDGDISSEEYGKSIVSDNIEANEILLELMVKIAAHPEQWEKIHKLLQKIDRALTSKRLTTNRINTNRINKKTESELVKEQVQVIPVQTQVHIEAHVEDQIPQETNNTEKVQKMIVILNGENKNSNNSTETALKLNQWPHYEPKPFNDVSDELQSLERTKYPWQSKSNKNSYPRNFAYHRVTGRPLYHYNKNPKAYIAVSVIAPKPLGVRMQNEDLILENELRQLKPWTNSDIRTRWLNDENKKKSQIP